MYAYYLPRRCHRYRIVIQKEQEKETVRCREAFGELCEQLKDASIELLNKKIVHRIYYATDIIEGDIVLGDLPKLNIDLNISEYVMQEESFDDEFEEGTI